MARKPHCASHRNRRSPQLAGRILRATGSNTRLAAPDSGCDARARHTGFLKHQFSIIRRLIYSDNNKDGVWSENNVITKQTVLVLGAGASMPFGFPSGYDLKKDICFSLLPTKRRPPRLQLIEVGFQERDIEGFRLALLKSGKQSVDAFLEHRQEFLEVGKAAIACHLLPRENEINLLGDSAPRPNWYEYFFNKLNAKFDEFDKNTVSILTFNYDRSLEFFLYTALRNSYGRSHEECINKLRSIPVIHLYGQLGGFPGLSTDALEFGAAINPDTLKKSIAGIRIIHEDTDDLSQFKKAQDLFMGAERIIFLGFGYDPINFNRLAINTALKNHRGFKTILGSAHNITDQERNRIYSMFAEFNGSMNIDNQHGESLDFLRNHTPFD